ncbi:MAG: amidohydrolase family protein, partial [Candidatus Binatia bacterium]
MNTLLKSATLITMNPRREILEGFDLYVENDRIGNLAPQGSLTGKSGDLVLDCKGKFVIPGLISAHSHLTGMFQRGLWDETNFEAWASRSSATEGLVDLSAEEIFGIHCAACVELIRHGVTTALNMFTTMPYLSREKVDSACQAFKDTGLRGILALSLKDKSPDNEGIDPGAVSHDTWIRFA